VKGLGKTYVHTLVPGNNTLEAKRKEIIYKLKANGPSFRNQFENQWEKMIEKTNASRRDAVMEQYRNPTVTKTGKMTQKDKKFYESFVAQVAEETAQFVTNGIQNLTAAAQPAQPPTVPAARPAARPLLSDAKAFLLALPIVTVVTRYGKICSKVPVYWGTHFLSSIFLKVLSVCSGIPNPIPFASIETVLSSAVVMKWIFRESPVSFSLFTEVKKLLADYQETKARSRADPRWANTWFKRNRSMVGKCTGIAIGIVLMNGLVQYYGGPALFVAKIAQISAKNIIKSITNFVTGGLKSIMYTGSNSLRSITSDKLTIYPFTEFERAPKSLRFKIKKWVYDTRFWLSEPGELRGIQTWFSLMVPLMIAGAGGVCLHKGMTQDPQLVALARVRRNREREIARRQGNTETQRNRVAILQRELRRTFIALEEPIPGEVNANITSMTLNQLTAHRANLNRISNGLLR
jgi:hypothetical protein